MSRSQLHDLAHEITHGVIVRASEGVLAGAHLEAVEREAERWVEARLLAISERDLPPDAAKVLRENLWDLYDVPEVGRES